MKDDAVISASPAGFPWRTLDPFLFCVHHEDLYPAGDARLAPAASLAGRTIGSDFEGRDGWRMYHGDVVPGFPQHPHRGFETVTIVRRGVIDHADSLGAVARFGSGDVQWLTAGKGILHCEMFPLLDNAGPNPLELFQIWLNLPAAKKLVDPHFSMFWRDSIPKYRAQDTAGRVTEIDIVAGRIGTAASPPPPPESWASRPDAEVAIWTIKMTPFAEFPLPLAPGEVNRVVYFFRGSSMSVGARPIAPGSMVQLRPDREARLRNGPNESEFLLLQGRPIGEPVAQHGPFVMNSRAELQQAFADYQRTQFGGWPWPSDGPVHPKTEGRFARHPGGRFEQGSGAL